MAQPRFKFVLTYSERKETIYRDVLQVGVTNLRIKAINMGVLPARIDVYERLAEQYDKSIKHSYTVLANGELEVIDLTTEAPEEKPVPQTASFFENGLPLKVEVTRLLEDYDINAPDHLKIHLPGGYTFTIETDTNGNNQPYLKGELTGPKGEDVAYLDRAGLWGYGESAGRL